MSEYEHPRIAECQQPILSEHDFQVPVPTVHAVCQNASNPSSSGTQRRISQSTRQAHPKVGPQAVPFDTSLSPYFKSSFLDSPSTFERRIAKVPFEARSSPYLKPSFLECQNASTYPPAH
mmetsp:Transcript_10218/g.23280  ORF Transcript_10218/g.23280 Transcript_10218/m.23280 type:complete len:120 (+) Transcript_10218:1285-1644(+)